MENADSTTRRHPQEKEIDYILAEEFYCDPRFLKNFATSCKDVCDLDLDNIQLLESPEPQFKLICGGSGDLLVKAKTGEKRIAFLIENKIDARPQQRQAESYKTHAEDLREKGWNHAVTVLVAPSKYIGEKNRFDAIIDLEDVMEWLDSHDSRRRRYRRDIINGAIDRIRKAGVKVPDPKLRSLHSDCRDWFAKNGHRYEFPKLLNAYPSNDYWIDNIICLDCPEYIKLRHRFWRSKEDDKGMVDLIIERPTIDLDKLRTIAKSTPVNVARFPENKKKNSKGGKISLRVPGMRLEYGFCETTAREALAAMNRLTEFFPVNKDRIG